MNFAYFRKSERTPKEIIAKIKDIASLKKLKVLDDIELPNEAGHIVVVTNPVWVSKIVKEAKDMIGLIPCAVLITKNDGATFVGIGNPQLVGSAAHMHDIEDMLEEMDKTLRGLVDEAAGAGALKPNKIKLYATMTCPYCKMEKAYLEEKKVPFDYILVDQDQKAGQEMVDKTGQMGVPVTEVQYEDAPADFVVGFDRPRLNTLLGLKD